ncbi:cellobiose phosphorylase [Sulfitobacter sabulilitoris]|uniref:Cellobiose phosphorylase n=2 Tax=Sulfitobacter sabulilitoris TaxID=2562655 RepID=A0A5S3PCA1_9RHOB|nr:cellobiose phosphorylase [Sulfitobacter sabulilitoris]
MATAPEPPAQIGLLRELDRVRAFAEAARLRFAEPPTGAGKAAEWVLDNQFSIRRTIAQVAEDIPPAFYRRLPRLADPETGGVPRVFMLAKAALEASHLQVSRDGIQRFVQGAQAHDPLSIAELWALPTMLRLACLETICAAMADLLDGLTLPFEVSAPAPNSVARDETEAISRGICALADLSRIPWREVFETLSHVERLLRQDPAGVYDRMDFETRDRYRKAVEHLARRAAKSEPDVAHRARSLARSHKGAPVLGHVGWWLVDDGRSELEAALGWRPGPGTRLSRWLADHPGPWFAGLLLCLGLVSMAVPVAVLWMFQAGAFDWIAGLALSLAPASIIAVTLTHWIVTALHPPRVLPKLDFEDGIAADARTAVIVPVILRRAADARAALDRVERQWLLNPDPNLRMVLLSDLFDAPTQTTPQDAAIEAALTGRIAQLNAAHAPASPFVLLHRARRYAAADGTWRGWERKRGKIQQFNALIVSGAQDAQAQGFDLVMGAVSDLKTVRFAVTLDLDTIAPLGAVYRMIGALAHPLNRPEFTEGTPRPIRGYSFVQPRVEISPQAGSRSLFARLYTGDTAIDIYSRAVSDVYQDLFGEGIFIGKGAYCIAAMHRALAGAVPENTLVSHDLFEGAHGRTALASDIVVYEDFPATYLGYAARAHRWIRGDWQLLPWMRRQVPDSAGGRRRNPMSRLDLWKIFDNLRRSLLSPALVLLAVVGWFWLPGGAWLWTGLVMLAPGIYLLTDLVSGVAGGRRRDTVREWHRHFADHSGRWLLAVVFMAHDALNALDAIARTLWRIAVSKRKLLEWVSFGHATPAGLPGRAAHWRVMWPTVAMLAVLGAVMAYVDPVALAGAAPLLVLWLAAPEVAYYTARPHKDRTAPLAPSDRDYLRRVARRTWLYFERFAGPEDNWLPPDNFQTDPHDEIAHRTSPTNVGMLLTSALVARDLGHIGLQDFAVRIDQTLSTLDRLDRHHGHFLNWIDTRTLDPLEPRYISTVDSGNLAVSLVTLAEGCRDYARGPVVSMALWQGVTDLLGLLDTALPKTARQGDGTGDAASLAAIRATVDAAQEQPECWRATLDTLRIRLWPTFEAQLLARYDPAARSGAGELQLWLERITHHLDAMAAELDRLAPWCGRVDPVPSGAADTAELLRHHLALTAPLDSVDNRCAAARAALAPLETHAQSDVRDWARSLLARLERGHRAQSDLLARLHRIGDRAGEMALEMDFAPLFDTQTGTFFLGYNLSADRIDEHRYDLLLSEARLASFFAIAKHDVPIKHWFQLGRPMSGRGRSLAVLSWNGSMFEFLMPRLFLQTDATRLIGKSEIAAVHRQQAVGAALGRPWGVSESAFAARDPAQNYQYRAFGVAGLGLKRGLAEDYVVAPYASGLALAVDPGGAVKNLRRLEAMGATGRYGFYDALDFTTSALAGRRDAVPVKTYMAHHQGMLLGAIGNALLDDILVARFARNRSMQDVKLLLEERVPWEFKPVELPPEHGDPPLPAGKEAHTPQLFGWAAPITPLPQMQVIGNGRMSAWVSETGASALWWQDSCLTRWTGDPVSEDGLTQLYLRDLETGDLAALGRAGAIDGAAPRQAAPEAVFHAHKTEVHERINGLTLSLHQVMSPTDDVHIRRITVTNQSSRPRHVELSDYAEVVLAPRAGHDRHPAFSKLFVRSDWNAALGALVFKRRPHTAEDRPPVLLQRLICGAGAEPAGYDSDRRAVLGRYGRYSAPEGLRGDAGQSHGWTLDPVACLRARMRLDPGEHGEIAVLSIAAGSRRSATELAERYETLSALDWAEEDQRRTTALEARHLGMGQRDFQDAQALCRDLVYPCRAPSGIDAALPAQPDLWPMGISGDLPIVVLHPAFEGEETLLRETVRAHHWLRTRGLPSDLVVLGHAVSGYEEPVRDRIVDILGDLGGVVAGLGGDGGVHFFNRDQLLPLQNRALEGAACLMLDAGAASLGEARRGAVFTPREILRFPSRHRPEPEPRISAVSHAARQFDNTIGGFVDEGRAYQITLEPRHATPMPWCNILANDGFGSIVTEAGLGFSWAQNSGEHRLTPWSNDPLTDAPGEAMYLRDEDSALVWSPTPLPAGRDVAFEIEHRAGRTAWSGARAGLHHRLEAWVADDAPVKLMHLAVRNTTGRTRIVTATYYAQWLLGAMPGPGRGIVATGFDAACGALVARNGWQADTSARVAFVTATMPPHSYSSERADVIGRAGDALRPEGLYCWDLGQRGTAEVSPCAAYQVLLEIPPGATRDVTFALGEGADQGEARRLARRWSSPGAAADTLPQVDAAWERRLGAVEVKTPDPALDVMVNHWLLYQTYASRLMARAGFYQAGGALGFRDQLQDVMAVLMSRPGRARAHILEAAARQFEEGDVLHWWHPPDNRGVRTRCSDDYLWLVYATARYVEATGDTGILDEEIPYLSARPLAEGEHDRYVAFGHGRDRGSLLEHCRRAMDRSTLRGGHGLPLIGSGDWNDGMDRVGIKGRGESVWLAWFLSAVSDDFAQICRRVGRDDLAGLWSTRGGDLRACADTAAWDGAWFIRAFDDDGLTWGARASEECKIDNIAQSWSVLCRPPDADVPEHATQAVAQAEAHLVDPVHRLIRLLTPPFDKTPRNPGYIRAYPPGIRENGGQYTHAATWLGLAHARLGDGDAAYRVFDLINPIKRTSSAAGADHYRGEPYVVAADVGGAGAGLGRAGWTWYTGAAAWTWRLAVEGVLGLSLRDGAVRIAPCLPRAWEGYTARLRGATGDLELRIDNSAGVGQGAVALTVDGVAVEGNVVAFPKNGARAKVTVKLLARTDAHTT